MPMGDEATSPKMEVTPAETAVTPKGATAAAAAAAAAIATPLTVEPTAEGTPTAGKGALAECRPEMKQCSQRRLMHYFPRKHS